MNFLWKWFLKVKAECDLKVSEVWFICAEFLVWYHFSHAVQVPCPPYNLETSHFLFLSLFFFPFVFFPSKKKKKNPSICSIFLFIDLGFLYYFCPFFVWNFVHKLYLLNLVLKVEFKCNDAFYNATHIYQFDGPILTIIQCKWVSIWHWIISLKCAIFAATILDLFTDSVGKRGDHSI